MKVAIISNCQGESLANLIMRMSTTVVAHFTLITKFDDPEVDIKPIFEEYDYVFGQGTLRPHVPEGMEYKVIYFPSIVFTGLHPDLTFARGKLIGSSDWSTLTSPLVVYHSAIAIAGYLEGLDVAETLTYYNSDTYARLGYFDAYEASRRELMREGEEAGMPLEGAFERWRARGAFMYSMNHPDLDVMRDITEHLLKKIGQPVIISGAAIYMDDPLVHMPIWPVYPEIGMRHGISGGYIFKPHDPYVEITLGYYIGECFKLYDTFDKQTIQPINVDLELTRSAMGLGGARRSRQIEGNPYSKLPSRQFWKKSVATPAMEDVDPVVTPSFQIFEQNKIATAGSCFAQHIAKTLQRSGYNYFVSEAPPEGLSEDEAALQNYNVYSARYGNIYTARQLAQLIDRVNGRFSPVDDAWLRADGKYVDPFRPQIVPEGFETIEALHTSRAVHFEAVRQLLRETDIFVFTLGLTESWRSYHDGAVFPLAPGVAGGQMDFDAYEFVNFSVNEVVQDMHKFIGELKTINPSCKVVLTVSPVPLIATYEPENALVATTLSKSVLRVAADMISKAYDHVTYFPSYEIITGAFNRGAYFDDDLRTVKPEGVGHVMKLFMKHFVQGGGAEMAAETAQEDHATSREPRNKLFDIVCDEEAIARF